MNRSHYEVLELSPNASFGTIAAAFSSLLHRALDMKNEEKLALLEAAKETLCDKNSDPVDMQIARIFVMRYAGAEKLDVGELSHAHAVLSDPIARLEYDRSLKHAVVSESIERESEDSGVTNDERSKR